MAGRVEPHAKAAKLEKDFDLLIRVDLMLICSGKEEIRNKSRELHFLYSCFPQR